MTGLLISIRDDQEATLASQFPIGIIDVKEPDRGALGCADKSELWRIVARLGDDVVKSVALGELRDRIDGPGFGCALASESADANEVVRPHSDGELISHFRFAKIGLAGALRIEHWQQHWLVFANSLPTGVQPVGVAYLDHERCGSPSPAEVMELIKCQSNGAMLVDTFDKSSGDAVSLWGFEKIKNLVIRARQKSISIVVAGSIKESHLFELIKCEPDFVGVRGAVCNGGRSKLDAERLNSFCNSFNAAMAELSESGTKNRQMENQSVVK